MEKWGPECCWAVALPSWLPVLVGRRCACRVRDPGAVRCPSARQCVPSLSVLSEHCHLMLVLHHVANERPIQTSLGDQLGFSCSRKLIMSLSLVQFQQLMYLRIHKWPFVFGLSDMCVAVLFSPYTCSLLYLRSRTSVRVLVSNHRNELSQCHC